VKGSTASESVNVEAAAAHLRSRIGAPPPVGIVLGSGLGRLEGEVADPVTVPFDEVPGYPRTSVAGHAGRYVVGRLGGARVLLQCGRFHAYEGLAPDAVAAPVRVAAALGLRTMIFTNAAGGIRHTLEPGDLVLVEDHVNWMFGSPLSGPVRGGEERFPDMSAPYDPELRGLARDVALELGERIEEGTYAAVLGPQYETPAEVRMLARFGADLVGMSTVPEVLVARALGLRCLAFSVVTNEATGLGQGTLGHEEVMERGRVAGVRLAALLKRLVPRIADEPYSASTK
jgi:purine-nucleoside phosphorylase